MTSRRKGKEGELLIGRWLAQAWYGQVHKGRTVFVRTKGGVRQDSGDLTVPDDFPALVEVKNTILHPFKDRFFLAQVAQDLIHKALKQGKLFGLVFFRLDKKTFGVLLVAAASKEANMGDVPQILLEVNGLVGQFLTLPELQEAYISEWSGKVKRVTRRLRRREGLP